LREDPILLMMMVSRDEYSIIYWLVDNQSQCGKIGVLPNGHVHVRTRVSSANLCADIN
jgi:hypothetical protein